MKENNYTYNEARAIGAEATRQLINLSAIRYFQAAPRVINWQNTLTAAYTWLILNRGGDPVAFPEGATTLHGVAADSANNIIESFDNWLGHGTPASDCLEFALEEVAR
jgi:hypothetical protein